MNNKITAIVIALLLWGVNLSAQHYVVTPQVYAFGFSASFNDSTVYFTEIHEIDSVVIDSKTKFLTNRQDYAYQLRDYFANRREANRTCIISFALKRKDIEKKYLKMKKKYTQKGNFDVKYLTNDQFMFKSVKPLEILNEDDESNKADKKKDKKKRNDRRPPQGAPNGRPPQGGQGGMPPQGFGGGTPPQGM